MFTIQRGATPTVTATIPETIDLTEARTIWFSVAQEGTVIIDKVTEDFSVDGQVISVRLTQAETLALRDDVRGKAQIRLLMQDGTAIPSKKRFVAVEGLVKDGVIT